LEDYFDGAPQLEQSLRKKNKKELLVELKRSTMDSGEIVYIRQRDALGLGHAVWCARRLIANEPFAVILPDDVIAAEKPCLKQMVEAYEKTGGCMVAAMEVPPSMASSYGLLDVAEDMGSLLKINGMVEKPEPENAPSNLAVIGRYILTPDVLRNVGELKRGAGGEIQLTDAIAMEIQKGTDVFGFRFDGQRYDCGSKSGFLQATIAFALSRPELRDELMDFLVETVETRRAAQ
jgi:UTP--glucose-1-phosphate uridylyltransferase